jgi:WD40 repeat protein
VAFSPDGGRIAAGSSGRRDNQWRLIEPGGVKVWDAATGKELLALKGEADGVESVAFSPDGGRIAAGSSARWDDKGHLLRPGRVKVWDAATGKELLTLTDHAGGVKSVVFSPDGQRIAAIDEGVPQSMFSNKPRDPGGYVHPPGIKVWDASSGELKLTIVGHWVGSPQMFFSSFILPVKLVVFSPDGRHIVSAAGTNQPDVRVVGEIKVWDAATGREILSLKKHNGPRGHIYGVALSPDDQRIVAACGGRFLEEKFGEVKVWDAFTGQEKLSLRADTVAVLGVAFSPDGQRIVGGCQDGTIKVWEAPFGQK